MESYNLWSLLISEKSWSDELRGSTLSKCLGEWYFSVYLYLFCLYLAFLYLFYLYLAYLYLACLYLIYLYLVYLYIYFTYVYLALTLASCLDSYSDSFSTSCEVFSFWIRNRFCLPCLREGHPTLPNPSLPSPHYPSPPQRRPKKMLFQKIFNVLKRM